MLVTILLALVLVKLLFPGFHILGWFMGCVGMMIRLLVGLLVLYLLLSVLR